MSEIVAIKGCDDAAFVAANIAKIGPSSNPVRHFPKERIICANFEGSELLRDWLGKIEWQMIDGFQCGFFKEVKDEG